MLNFEIFSKRIVYVKVGFYNEQMVFFINFVNFRTICIFSLVPFGIFVVNC